MGRFRLTARPSRDLLVAAHQHLTAAWWDHQRHRYELFTDDAQILVEHGPVIAGREDIQHFLSEQITPIISFNTEADMTTVRSDIGIEQGHYRVRDVRRGSDVEEGKYIHVWRKQGGDWKLWRVIWNADVAPDTEVSVSQAPEGAM